MKKFMRIWLAATAIMAAVSFADASAQELEPSVRWNCSANDLGDGLFEIVLDGEVLPGWHTYDLHSEYSSTYIEFGPGKDFILEGEPYELIEAERVDELGEYYERAAFGQKVALKSKKAVVKGKITWMSCIGTECRMPEEWEFAVEIRGSKSAAAPAGGESAPFDWALVIEAILWGFAALLTPCVFPMVPMTVSFFLKGSENKAAGRAKALLYGLFIIALYTLPIAVIILITRFVGGDAVTADIFNWLATHWLPNILFFVVFMIFAASFFGAFEITLPSSIVNKSDRNSDKGGIVGIFFMALTLVLVSFSCTGPIVGSVLIKSTAGEFLQPIVTMFFFSAAFALPFTLFALFPSLLKNLPKSGGWLNSVKVVLGFVEVALGFKFLSVADQTYHWGLLDREVYLAIWIVCFTLLGLYLLGKLRFAHDSKLETISVTRLALAIGVFTFVVYMIPGMWGAPLKALSGYLPPMHTQDFVIEKYASPAGAASSQGETPVKAKYGDLLHLPHGLDGYFDLDEALAAAQRESKPVFVDITGHGCVNCREMEARVWSAPEVLDILRNDYVVAAIYTDDKMTLPESEWLTTDTGKVLKTMGAVNSYIARTRFNVNAQPNYVLLSPEGVQLAPTRGYDLSVEGFVKFLQGGLDAYAAQR